jgi:hypothetical protein
MQGKTEYQILTDDQTAAAAARSTAYLKRLQAAKRLRDHRAAAQSQLEGATLRPWQAQARAALLEYSPLALTPAPPGFAPAFTPTSISTPLASDGHQMKKTASHGAM